MKDKEIKLHIERTMKNVKSINDFIVFTINIRNLYGHNTTLWSDEIYKYYNGVKEELLYKIGLTDEELTLVMLSRQYNFNIPWFANRLAEMYKEIGKDVKNSRATQIARELTQGSKAKWVGTSQSVGIVVNLPTETSAYGWQH